MIYRRKFKRNMMRVTLNEDWTYTAMILDKETKK